MEKKYVNIGKETLAYLDEGQGEVVLMIHGNMSSGVHYEPLISRIKDKYRCIAVVLRGFGDSTYNERFDTLDELAEDVNLLLEALGLDSVYLVGWSNGGGVGLKLCALHPEKIRKFFDIEGASMKGYPLFVKDEKFQSTGKAYENKAHLATDPLSVAPMIRVFETKDAPMMTAVWDATIYTVGKPTKEQSELWIQETLKQRNIVDLDWALASLNMSEEYTPYGKGDGTIRNVTCPVALTMGEKDIVVPGYMVMENYNALANATLLPYENCGHSPMVDCPDRLAADVCAFFA